MTETLSMIEAGELYSGYEDRYFGTDPGISES